MEQIQISNRAGFLKNLHPAWFLLAGIITIFAAHLSYGMDAAAWISSLPFLIYLDRTKGFKSRLFFYSALLAAWSFATAKIISPPIPYGLVFLYSVPLSLFHLPAYLIWGRFREEKFAVLIFPAVFVLIEWLQYTFTPFASWGVAAYTQVNTPVMMQFLSVFGMAGLGFLIYWVNSSLAEFVAGRKRNVLNLYAPLSAVILVLIFGMVRYSSGNSSETKTMKLAAVGTDSEVSGLPLPSKESNAKVIETLFGRTRQAANAGAKLIVWNEASAFILPEDENAWTDSLAAIAAELNIGLVAAYVVPVSTDPLKYENKYQFFDSAGNSIYTYHKHQPVPGEPAINGTEKLNVFNMNGAKTGAAICYDYDFPYLAKAFGNLDADLVAVPSSDWKGIDPIHTQMAAFRALEQGHSILRSTRFGLSAAIDPYGKMIAKMSSFDANNKIMLAELPVRKVRTVYSVIGDSFIYACIGFIAFFFSQIILKKQKNKN